MRRIIKVFIKQDCPGCLQVKKFLGEYSKKYPRIKIRYYDVGEVEGLSQSAYYNIYSTPTTLIFRDNTEIRRIMGNIDERNLS